MIKAIEYSDQQVKILDQTQLPDKIQYLLCQTPEDIYAAIQKLQVRGAPLIGIAAAFGLVLALQHGPMDHEQRETHFAYYYSMLRSARPTAVNLAWALDRMKRVFEQTKHLPEPELFLVLQKEAKTILDEDAYINHQIGNWGKTLFSNNSQTIMTICNAGALATGGYGTALGVIRALHADERLSMVWALETRPVLQGGRLTVWELMQDNIPVTLITDNMAAYVMKHKNIDAVITGADRIAANGDTANKIGTYSLAVLAAHHNIPFYIAAPESTFDRLLSDGSKIPIEERDADEIRKIGDYQLTPKDALVYNPAFDVTPHELITGIITENGILKF